MNITALPCHFYVLPAEMLHYANTPPLQQLSCATKHKVMDSIPGHSSHILMGAECKNSLGTH